MKTAEEMKREKKNVQWSGYGELGNISQKPLQPTAEGAEANRHIRQLKEFHTAFNLPQRDIPTIIPPDEFKLRHKILVEEVGELSDAYFVDDIVEVADAITDCLYVLIGTALQFGIADKLEACFDEVHRSNMSKLGNDGYPIMREDGKVMKGENYTRPDLKSILSEPIVAQQQPTAEGAEEILASILESLGEPINIHNHAFEIRPYTVDHKTEWWIFHKEVASGEPLAQWLSKFATLHAQKIADKMYPKEFLFWFHDNVQIESSEETFLVYNDIRFYTLNEVRDFWQRVQEKKEYVKRKKNEQ